MKAVSGKHLCKVLARIKSSHHIYKNQGGSRTVSVPVHGNRNLPTGTQHAIMKDAGITEAEL